MIPNGRPGERTWNDVGDYAKNHLAAHAGACGLLDDLVTDPGYLAVASPGSILTQRGDIRTPGGHRAVSALELSLDRWESFSERGRRERLAANAARLRAESLLEACARMP